MFTSAGLEKACTVAHDPDESDIDTTSIITIKILNIGIRDTKPPA